MPLIVDTQFRDTACKPLGPISSVTAHASRLDQCFSQQIVDIIRWRVCNALCYIMKTNQRGGKYQLVREVSVFTGRLGWPSTYHKVFTRLLSLIFTSSREFINTQFQLCYMWLVSRANFQHNPTLHILSPAHVKGGGTSDTVKLVQTASQDPYRHERFFLYSGPYLCLCNRFQHISAAHALCSDQIH